MNGLSAGNSRSQLNLARVWSPGRKATLTHGWIPAKRRWLDMSRTNKMTRNLLAQEPGRVDCNALAADTQIITQRKLARHNGGTQDNVKTTVSDIFPIVVSGTMTRLQIIYLRRLHGLNEAQANALAVLIWGTT
jgi:hypothetical protein